VVKPVKRVVTTLVATPWWEEYAKRTRPAENAAIRSEFSMSGLHKDIR